MIRLPTVSNHFNSFRKKRSGSVFFFLSILFFGFLYLLSLGFVFPLRIFLATTTGLYFVKCKPYKEILFVDSL